MYRDYPPRCTHTSLYLTSENLALSACLWQSASWTKNRIIPSSSTSSCASVGYQCRCFAIVLSGQQWQVRLPIPPLEIITTTCTPSCHCARLRTLHHKVDVFPSLVGPRLPAYDTLSDLPIDAFHLTQSSVAILAILSMMFLSVIPLL